MSALPTLQEELDRKVFDTLEWIAHAQASGRISDAQASTAVDVVFRTTSGLVKDDGQFIAIITHMSDMYKGAPRLTRIFVNNDRVAKVEWEIGTSVIETTVYMHGVATSSKITECDTPAEAKQAGEAIIAKLQKLGFTKI